MTHYSRRDALKGATAVALSSLAYDRAQAQGGRVTFNPAGERGACFTLHIPTESR